MPAGRPPKPLERRKATAKGDGVDPGHREVKGEVVPYTRTISIPPAPSELGHRGEVEWYKVWEAGPWLHPAEDYHWILQIAQSYDDIEEFRAEVKKTGLIVKGYAPGQFVSNPLLKDIRLAEATIRKCLSQIGFSPADRARLGLVEVKRQTGLADLQNKTRKNRG